MRWQSKLVLALVLGGLALCIRVIRLDAFDKRQAGQRFEDIYYLPRPDFLPVLSLGYRDALADLIWCKSLVYFGDQLGHRGIVKFVFEYSDAILALDPDYRAAYRWAATASMYRPTPVSLADGRHGASYLQRAVDRWPDDGELEWDLGSLLRFELMPLEADPAAKRALMERAAPHLEAAARLGAGPPWLALNNAKLLNTLGRTDQAIRHLEELRVTINEPSILRDIDYQLRKLKTASYLEAARVADADYQQAHDQSYPYLSDGLFWLLGPKQQPVAYQRYLSSLFLDPPAVADEP
jgi:hypothetical protein